MYKSFKPGSSYSIFRQASILHFSKVFKRKEHEILIGKFRLTEN